MSLCLVPALGACNRPTAADAQLIVKDLDGIAVASDATLRARLLYRACGEIESCAQGCKRAFDMCAGDTDDAQRATLIAACSTDYRDRRKAGEKLSPDVWVDEHMHKYLDRVREVLPEAERGTFDTKRAAAKL